MCGNYWFLDDGGSGRINVQGRIMMCDFGNTFDAKPKMVPVGSLIHSANRQL